MKFGVWGCRHLHVCDGINPLLAEGHSFLGIAETEGPCAPQLAARYGVPLLPSAEALFALAPQLIISSALNSQKIDIAEECAKKNIPLMLDKPAVITQHDFTRLEQLLAAQNTIGLMLTERFNPACITAKELIDSGTLGRLVSLNFHMPHKLAPQTREEMFFHRETQGGLVADLSVHSFDLLRWFTASEILHTGGYIQQSRVAGHEDFAHNCHLLAHMENGITAHISINWWTPAQHGNYGDGRILITGTEGCAEVFTTGCPAHQKKPYVVVTTNSAPAREIMCEPPATNLMQDFMHKINGRPHQITNRDILGATRAALLASTHAKRIIQQL